MMTGNFKMALDSIRAAKWRSLLTMLGIIVGVLSVVTIVSIGEGVKREVVGQIDHLGSDLLTVRPGTLLNRDGQGQVVDVNLLGAFASSGTLNENDMKTISKVPGVGVMAPMAMVTGAVSLDGRDFPNKFVIGTNEGMQQVLNQKVEFGGFFREEDANANVAVIGNRVATELFNQNAPVGQSFMIHGEKFIIRGVFEQFDNSPLAPNSDYNHAIFIPFSVGKSINNNQSQIQQIYVKPDASQNVSQVAAAIDTSLRQAHGGQRDYTILKQEDNVAIANKVLNLLTGLISGIAAISLIVGGIGIMNIMLVAVSERTNEIGIRKAIGATNKQIMSQFLVESALLSFIGGMLGILLSLVANYFLRVFTSLQPVVTWQVVVIALVVALVVGVFFGVAPALKAARKDPIEALRS
jgi:ABC-type antimicrobial peptide transport system permease subunit